MPFQPGDDSNRASGDALKHGGRPSNAERIRARQLVTERRVLESLAAAAGQKKPNVGAARTLLQVAGLLTEHVEHDHRYPDLEGATDQELAERIEELRAKVLPFRRSA
jgi:hypothetical protein